MSVLFGEFDWQDTLIMAGAVATTIAGAVGGWWLKVLDRKQAHKKEDRLEVVDEYKRLMLAQDARISRLEAKYEEVQVENDSLRAELYRSERYIDRLTAALKQAGIPIPAEPPPDAGSSFTHRPLSSEGDN